MSAMIAALIGASLGVSGLAYWRAARLHFHIVAIDPAFRGLVDHALDYFWSKIRP